MKTFTSTTTDYNGLFNQPQKQIDRIEYEQKLKQRQEEHLKSLFPQDRWQPCLHDQCQQCHGTGISRFGPCVHMISCPCPKCSPSYM